MTELSLVRAYNPVKVNLWGTKFETINVARSGAIRGQELEDEIKAIESTPSAFDELAEKLGEILDLKLQSVDGKGKKPSTILKKQWKTDGLPIRDLLDFLDEISSAEGEGNRPT